MVYENLIPQPTGHALGPVFAFGVRSSNKRSDMPTTRYFISQTCRQIRQEALYTYFSSSPFTFDFLWHKDIEAARRWLTCQADVAISSMRDITFRHGSLDHEHHALINIDLRKPAASVQDNAFESCLSGKILPLVVRKLQAIVEALESFDGKKILTKDAFGEMLDVLSVMFGMQWPEGMPITLCHNLY